MVQPERRVEPVAAPRKEAFAHDVSNALPHHQFRRKKNQWLIPAVVGGAVVIIAGIAFVLAWEHAPVQVADTPVDKTRNGGGPTKPQSPPPRVNMPPPNAPKPRPSRMETPTQVHNSDGYGPATLTQALAAVEVTSPSFGSGGNPEIIINGRAVRHGREPFRRGLFVVALVEGKVVLHQLYDCLGMAGAADQFAEAIKKLPEGAIVILVVGDDATQNFNQHAQHAVLSIGGQIGLLGKPIRSTYYCIGQKGLGLGLATEEIGQHGLHYPANTKSQSDAPSLSESHRPNSLQAEGEDSGRQIDGVPVLQDKVQITLPPGDKLTEEMLNVPEDWKEMFLSKEKEGAVDHYVHVELYANNEVWGAFTMNHDKLDGAAERFSKMAICRP